MGVTIFQLLAPLWQRSFLTRLKCKRIALYDMSHQHIEIQISLKEIIPKLFTVNFSPFVVLLGVPPFAIVAAPVLDINLGLSGYANANITTSLAQNFTIDKGMQYLKEEGWSSYVDTV